MITVGDRARCYASVPCQGHTIDLDIDEHQFLRLRAGGAYMPAEVLEHSLADWLDLGCPAIRPHQEAQ